jgi:hypothetical protein
MIYNHNQRYHSAHLQIIINQKSIPSRKYINDEGQNQHYTTHNCTLLVSWKESTPGNLSSSPTKTLFKRISPFWTILRPILFSIFVAVNPGASFFTINLNQKAEILHMQKKRMPIWKTNYHAFHNKNQHKRTS